jgi:hypothetical protein
MRTDSSAPACAAPSAARTQRRMLGAPGMPESADAQSTSTRPGI